MKKLLLTLLLLFSVGMVAMAVGTDVLTNASLNKGTNTNSSGYKAFTSGTFVSGAQYAGKVNFVKNKTNYYFALNNGNNSASDIVTIVSGGCASSVKITWTTVTSTSNGRVVKVYGQHKAYTSGDKEQGTEIGSCTKGTNASETIDLSDKTYEYIAISAPSSVNLESIEIEWIEAATAEKIELDATNLEVKAGEQELGSEAELDANTTISWKYNYIGEVANPDITYSYSVDGGEEVEGNEYTYTGEKDVELTVKATSTNTVSKTVKLLKKYPTVCPEPVFNVEDGAKVYAGQAVTVSCEGADIEWTVNDVTITGTSYTITEEVGTQLTFYALASIEGRNPSTGNIETLTAEKEITVTVDEATEALFNFEAGNTYGLTSCSGTDYEKDKGNLTAISNGIVTLSFTEGSNYRFWGNDNTLRIYKGCTLTASVPEGYYITNITMTGKDLTQINYSDEFVNTDITVSNKDYEHVTQTGSANIKTLTVKYAKVPDPELDGEPTINVTHASKKGVLIVEYSFKIANHNGKPVEVTANIAGMEHIAFVDATPANAPARVAGESTTVSGTLRAEHADLVDASNLNVNLKATLGGKEFFTRQATVTNTTGIEDVTVEGEGDAEYFNLQGLRVAQPEAGQLYIKRQAGKAVKVRF